MEAGSDMLAEAPILAIGDASFAKASEAVIVSSADVALSQPFTLSLPIPDAGDRKSVV